MAESGESYVVELQAGVGDPPFVPLHVGTVLNPMSIGRRGMWRVEASGVLDVHAYMYFDGRSLFLQSADEERPILAHGRAVGRTWTSVNPPCTITVGNARLEFRSTHDEGEHVEDMQTAVGRQPPAARPARPFEPGAFTRRSDDDEATRMHPVEGASRVGIPRPAAGMPSMPAGNIRPMQPTPVEAPRHMAPPTNPLIDAPTRFAGSFVPRSPQLEDLYNAPAMGPPPMMNAGPPPMLNIPRPGPGALPAQPQPVGAWDKLSGPKKILLLMSPFLLMAIYLLFRDEPQPPARPRPAASVPDAAPSNPYAQATPSRPPPLVPSAAPTPPPSFTTPPPTLSVSALPSASHTPPSDHVVPPPIASAPVTKTLERTAVDLVTSGQYEKAAQIYDQLALANPSNAAYREAARILRQKIDGGS